MLDDALASRYEFGTQTTEDKFGRHVVGRRLSDGIPVVKTVLDPQLKVDPKLVVALTGDSQLLAPLKSPGILHCLESGQTEGGNLYVVFEGSEAPTLKTFLKTSGGLTIEQALSVTYQIAGILHQSSSVGVHHLGLSNQVVHLAFDDALRVHVGGFGFAHLLPSYNPSRRNDPSHGTAEYMAPEVCAGRPGDHSSDLYALGILMYEMIAGKPPFLSSSPSTTIKRQVYEKPLPMHLVKLGMEKIEEFEGLVNRLLAKDPRARPQNAQELLTQLTQIRDQVFPDVTLSQGPQRNAAVDAVTLIVLAAAPAPQESAPAQGETMMFTGLSEAIVSAQAARDASEGQVSSGVASGDSRPTEAFDSDFIAAALDAAAVKEKQASEVQEDLPQTTETEESRAADSACRNLHPRNRRTAGIEKAGGEAVPMDCVGWAR